MPKAVSPAVGFNDNVRRRNRNFHVQTEDSGVARPHIITHLFTDGGRIVKSVRQSYADIVEEENLSRSVRERMKAQHVGMLEALKSGEFDALVWGSRAPGKKPGVVPPADSSRTELAVAKPVDSTAVATPADSTPAISSGAISSGILPSAPGPSLEDLPPIPSSQLAVIEGTEPPKAEPVRLPVPPRRSTPPLARKQPQPPPRKTMPRIDATPIVVASAGAARARKSAPPKARRTSRPPPRLVGRPSSSSVANPRDGLVSQTLDEVILRMLSEEQDTKSGS